MTTPATPMPGPWALPARLREFVARLPVRPPSTVAAVLLDRLLRPHLDDEARRLLADRVVEVHVIDLGLRCRLVLGPGGFRAAVHQQPTALRIACDARNYLRLLRGEEDADRLFFERSLVMEGDTEYGLVLKNTLDAIGPLVRWPPRA
jgi:predicted lipid carrier protein YhbT